MAKTFDVTLRKRLTEFDLIIRNLPYRDHLVLFSKTYLEAMINYLSLQKFIVGEADSTLQAEIDDLLARAFNMLNNKITMESQIGLTNVKFVDGGAQTEFGSDLTEIGEESFNTLQNVTELLSRQIRVIHKKFAGYARSAFILRSHSIEPLETTFERLRDNMVLHSIGSTTADTFLDFKSEMILNESRFDIFYLAALQTEAVLNLLFDADCYADVYINDIGSGMILRSGNDTFHLIKFLSLDSVFGFLSDLNEVLECLLSLDASDLYLDSEMSVGIVRYRILDEMDNFSLDHFDEDELEDVDYVTIE